MHFDTTALLSSMSGSVETGFPQTTCVMLRLSVSTSNACEEEGETPAALEAQLDGNVLHKQVLLSPVKKQQSSEKSFISPQILIF